MDFFLDGVIEIAQSAIEIALRINEIREADLLKIHKLGKVAAEKAIEVLRQMYRQPIVDVAKIQSWTGFTRAGAQKVINRLVDINILFLETLKRHMAELMNIALI